MRVNGANILAPGVPSSRLHRRFSDDWLCSANLPGWAICLEKSYPVTAAQLLPVFTEFLAPAHFYLISQRTGPRMHGFAGRNKGFCTRAVQIGRFTRGIRGFGPWSRSGCCFYTAHTFHRGPPGRFSRAMRPFPRDPWGEKRGRFPWLVAGSAGNRSR